MKRIMQMKRIVQNDQTAPWKRQSDCIRICRVRSESSYNAETLLREREVERERDLHTEEWCSVSLFSIFHMHHYLLMLKLFFIN